MNSRDKGARGEREWAAYLAEMGFPARRGCQFQGTPDSPDVSGGIPGTHAEVKRVERLNVDAAMEQAEADAGDAAIPYVAHRRNRKPWLVTLRACDLVEFARAILREDGDDGR
jgi:Holliday junction resolvase